MAPDLSWNPEFKTKEMQGDILRVAEAASALRPVDLRAAEALIAMRTRQAFVDPILHWRG
jgi:hypothetical protein